MSEKDKELRASLVEQLKCFSTCYASAYNDGDADYFFEQIRLIKVELCQINNTH